MKKNTKKAIWEAIKFPLRLIAIALIPFAITYVASFDAQWAIYVTGALIFIDKLMHELGKAKKSDLLVGGLTRF